MKTINVALIGYGIGQKHFEAIQNYKGSKVLMICEKDKKKLSLLKSKFPNIEITNNENKIFANEKIDLVSIASFDNFHYSQMMKSIKKKKNIIVEKPMCLTLDQLINLKKQINKSKVKVTSNLVLRVNNLFVNIKKKLRNDKIFYIEADYIWGRKNKLFGWRSKIKNYSLILGAGIHLIDLVMWLLDKRPISVYSDGNSIATRNTSFKKKSMVVVILKFPGNIIAKISANGVAIHDHFHELKIFTNSKTITNTPFGSFTFKNKKFTKNNFSYPDKSNRKKLIQNFIDHLLNKKIKPIISLKEQFDLMSVCFAAEESIKKNKLIKINYI